MRIKHATMILPNRTELWFYYGSQGKKVKVRALSRANAQDVLKVMVIVATPKPDDHLYPTGKTFLTHCKNVDFVAPLILVQVEFLAYQLLL